MKAAAHSRKPPFVTTGFRAMLGRLVAVTVLAGAVLVFGVASAEALVTHDYLPGVSAEIDEGIPSVGPHGEPIPAPGQLELGPLSMTVDSGHLWAVEAGSRIDEFDAATGAFLSQLTTHPPGVSFSVGNHGAAGIAVGHANGEAQVYVGEGDNAGSALAQYSESGTLKETWTGAGTPAGSFGTNGMDVAVDNSTNPLDEDAGDVYVVSSRESPFPNVVDVFHPEADGKEHYVGQITGPSPSEPFISPTAVGVDDTNGDVIVAASNVIYIFEPTVLGEYVLAHTITGPPSGAFTETFNLSVDAASGDIYVDVLGGAHGVVIDQFSSTGAYLGRITGDDTVHAMIADVYAVAVDSASHNVYVGDVGVHEMDVFGPGIVFPDVTTEPPSSQTPFSATLNGTVNPQNAGTASCRFEWGTGKAFGKTAPCEPEAVANGGSPVPVHAALSGLQSDTTYFYRLEASNGNGVNPGEESQDQQFTTPGPGIREESVTNLADTSATFEASIAPHGVPSSYYFQYGTSANYGTEVPAQPGEAIGSGESAVDVTPRHVQGLLSDTVYHYRVVVVTEPHPGETVVFYGPDQVFLTQTPGLSELPDNRQWEMVTPPDKKGATIVPIWESGVERAADDGDAIAFMANNPTEAEPQGFQGYTEEVSRRGAEDWTTRNVASPHGNVTGPSIGQGEEYRLFSSDLSLAVIQPLGNFQPTLSAEASEATPMLRSLDPSCGSSCFRPLVTGKPGFANVPPGTVFGEEPEGTCENLYCGPEVATATPDLAHIIVGVSHLGDVEWSGGKLSAPIDVGPHNVGTPRLARTENPRGILSNDGSRVILEEGTALFMRDLKLEKTVQLNVAEPACVAAHKCASGEGEFQLASTDGSKVFFTNLSSGSQPHRLTKNAGDVGSDLYECEMVESAGELECKLSDIAPEALGVLGASEDGSYMYFVSNSALAEGATPGECPYGNETPPAGATCNLYVRHGNTTKFVALLSPEDLHDWLTEVKGSPARVSPDGNWLEFMSQRSVTGYDNRDVRSGKTDAEVYLYDASTGRVACASCNPSGARPTGAEYFKLEPGSGGLTGGPKGVWRPNAWVAATVPGWLQYKTGGVADQPRFLSNSGRLFFNSGDALVPQDVNGNQDVYEYEPPGVGGCATGSATFSEASGGCVGLISSGTSAEESAFLEASENGGDVFFLTYSKLLPQDYDNALDIYDARECTSEAACYPTPVPQPPACTTAEACRAAPTPQPTNFEAPSSATFSGVGDIAPTPATAAKPKPLTRAQKLANALKTCRKKPKRKRAVCEKRARAQYGPAKPRKAASKKKGKR